MEDNKIKTSSKIDILIWILIIAIIAGSIVTNQCFKEIVWSLRFVVGIVVVVVLWLLALLTAQGKRLWTFIKAARVELYKVVWPSRDETIKTTAVVAALVFAMSIILWLFDSILLKIVNWFTN